MSLAVAEDGLTQGNSAADLVWWWCGGLYDLGANDFRVCWGRGEAGEVFVDLGRGRGWGGRGTFITANRSLET